MEVLKMGLDGIERVVRRARGELSGGLPFRGQGEPSHGSAIVDEPDSPKSQRKRHSGIGHGERHH